MKVRMLAVVAGPNYSAHPGQIIDVPTKDAEAMVKGGYAQKVPASTPVTKPVEEPPADEREDEEEESA